MSKKVEKGRSRKGKAPETTDPSFVRIKCRECGGKGKRYEDGSKKLAHETSCGRYQKPATPSKPSAKKNRESKATSTNPSSAQKPMDQASECRHLRDNMKMTWMAIGAKLNLSGSKSGAGAARRLYASVNGGVVPRTRVSTENTDKGTVKVRRKKANEHSANTGPKVDRKIRLVENGHVIPTDISDDEVLAMVRGRVIEWGINVSRLAGSDDNEVWMNEEARVHPVDLVMEEDLDSFGGRVIRFRMYHGIDDHGRHISGPTRTVRVNSIHTVR